MSGPLTQAVMDQMGCATPNCGHDHSVLYLNQACHTGAGVKAAYIKATGVLHVECLRCGKTVAEIQVAP